MFTVLYQSKTTYDSGVTYDYKWLTWETKIPTIKKAEQIRQTVVRIGYPARIIRSK